MILFNLLKKKKRQRLKITSIFSLNIWDNRREGKLILTSHLFPLLSFLFSCLSVEFWFTLFVRDTSCSINRFCLQVEKTKVKLWFNYHLLRQKILYYHYYYKNAKPLKLQKSCKTKETSSSTTFSFYFLCEFHLYYPEIKPRDKSNFRSSDRNFTRFNKNKKQKIQDWKIRDRKRCSTAKFHAKIS